MESPKTLRAADLALIAQSCSQSKSAATRSAASRVAKVVAQYHDPSHTDALQLDVNDAHTLTDTCQYSLKRSVRDAASRVSLVIADVRTRKETDPAASASATIRK